MTTMSQRRIDVTIAGQKITLAISDEHEPAQETPQASPTAALENSTELSLLTNEVSALEDQVDALLKTLSLPGSPRPIAP